MPLKDPIKRREYMREYLRRTYQRDKARRYERTLAWRKRNPEVFKATFKRYQQTAKYKAHMARIDKLDHRVAYRKNWKKSNSAKMVAINAKARLKRKLAVSVNGGTSTVEQWLWRCSLYGFRCAYCKSSTKRLEQDHVIPVSHGGLGWPSNLVPACRSCNAKKRDRKGGVWVPKLPKSGIGGSRTTVTES